MLSCDQFVISLWYKTHARMHACVHTEYILTASSRLRTQVFKTKNQQEIPELLFSAFSYFSFPRCTPNGKDFLIKTTDYTGPGLTQGLKYMMLT